MPESRLPYFFLITDEAGKPQWINLMAVERISITSSADRKTLYFAIHVPGGEEFLVTDPTDIDELVELLPEATAVIDRVRRSLSESH